MPESISTAEFLRETWDDYNSPPTSTFASRVGHCRSTVGALEEVGLARRPVGGNLLFISRMFANSAWTMCIVCHQ